MTTSGQICKMSYTAYCSTYCNMGQPYCKILQYAFCRIVAPLFLEVEISHFNISIKTVAHNPHSWDVLLELFCKAFLPHHTHE